MVQTNIQKLNLESITKFNNNFRHLMSGKLSISLLLKYLIKSNHINPKLNETFVPKFMGNWVYSSILQNSQIGTSLTNYTKILYMYHQFGIPQKVDVIKSFANENNLILIEDCAHILEATDKNNNSIINQADYSIYSFSKFIDCNTLGGILTKDEQLIKFIDNELKNSGNLQSHLIYFLYKLSKFFKENSLLREKITNMNYSLWHMPSKTLKKNINLFTKNIEDESLVRKNRFILLKEEVKNKLLADYFDCNSIIAQKLPVPINKSAVVEKILKKFELYKFPFEVLMFDKNRNFLKPDYTKCLILNPSSKNKFFENQIQIIRETL